MLYAAADLDIKSRLQTVCYEWLLLSWSLGSYSIYYNIVFIAIKSNKTKIFWLKSNLLTNIDHLEEKERTSPS